MTPIATIDEVAKDGQTKVTTDDVTAKIIVAVPEKEKYTPTAGSIIQDFGQPTTADEVIAKVTK